jgi:Retrotransposon gag protein/Zinc knuckle
MDNEAIDALEQKVAKMEAREVETTEQLSAIFAYIKQQPQSRNSDSTPFPAPHTDPPKTSRKARPATPPDFNGERSEGLAFLNSCQTYVRLCPEEFPDEQTKIVWAMSYMKTGRAQRWTARVFRWESLAENIGLTRFLDWEDFKDEFRKEFVPAHADALAINRLESTGYYQRNRSLDDYIDEFQDLIVDSGYTDPKTIVVKFRRGLNAQIQNVVATMAAGRPSDGNPAQWYDMARTVDQNRAANEAFSSSQRPLASTPRSATNSVFRLTPAITKPGNSHIHPTPGNPVPMDLDNGASRRSTAPLLCYRCKQPGHFGKDCPTRFDVREMTIDELQEILELRLAELDVAPTEEVASAEKEDF